MVNGVITNRFISHVVYLFVNFMSTINRLLVILTISERATVGIKHSVYLFSCTVCLDVDEVVASHFVTKGDLA